MPNQQVIPLDLIWPLVDKTVESPQHWYWLGDFNQYREAIFSHTRYTWVVARALINAEAVLKPRSGLRLGCGVVSCVNPAHWLRYTAKELARARRPLVFTDWDGTGPLLANRDVVCPVCLARPDQSCDPKKHP